MKKLSILIILAFFVGCGGSNSIGDQIGGDNDLGAGGEDQVIGDDAQNDDLSDLGELLEDLTKGKIEIDNFDTYLQGSWNIKAFSKANGPDIQSEITFNNGQIEELIADPFFRFEEGTLLENAQKHYDSFEVKEEFCKSELSFDAISYIPFNYNSYSTDENYLFGSYAHEFLGDIPQISYEFINTDFNPILKLTTTATFYPTCCLENEACQDGDYYQSQSYEKVRGYIVLAANENAFVVEANGYYVVLTRK